ncbi:hypothetical protein MMN18_04030 [Helicobacter pylori]|uniref:hypothetical protein n=1 Tax=Helicobacter pylori TaxID=210 RepID=UPI0030C56223
MITELKSLSLISVNLQCESRSLEQELFEDIMQVIHSFSMKMYSKRRIAKKLLIESKAKQELIDAISGDLDDSN